MGLVGHEKKFGFYSKWDGKPLEEFQQRVDITLSRLFKISLAAALIVRSVRGGGKRGTREVGWEGVVIIQVGD